MNATNLNQRLRADSLAGRIADYRNTAADNDSLYADFSRLTDTFDVLKRHRDFVEQNAWGFGDRAFHYMWYLILLDLAERFTPVKALEIGVYKGQVLSLWALIARELGLGVEISGISPFEGNNKPMPALVRKLRRLVDRRYRSARRDGNLYPAGDYLPLVEEIFRRFDLDAHRCRLLRGYSTDAAITSAVAGERFSVIFVDGDHSYEGVQRDIATYAPLLAAGGYLVMDDASCFIPGTGFWKGRESVSRACELIPAFGFENVLNVGHDRLYRKTPAARAAHDA
jgi:hypothetical protein